MGWRKFKYFKYSEQTSLKSGGIIKPLAFATNSYTYNINDIIYEMTTVRQ